jgi:hypothetical protein
MTGHTRANLGVRRTIALRARAEAAPTWHEHGFRRSVEGSFSGTHFALPKGRPLVISLLKGMIMSPSVEVVGSGPWSGLSPFARLGPTFGIARVLRVEFRPRPRLLHSLT